MGCRWLALVCEMSHRLLQRVAHQGTQILAVFDPSCWLSSHAFGPSCLVAGGEGEELVAGGEDEERYKVHPECRLFNPLDILR